MTKHKPRRLYTAHDMAKSVGLISDLRQKSFDYVPMATQAMGPVPTHEGHCIGCKTKKTFNIEGTDQMKNGAVRHYGACPDCGKTVSAFAAGVKDTNAA